MKKVKIILSILLILAIALGESGCMKVVFNKDKIESDIVTYLNEAYDDEFEVVEKNGQLDFNTGAYVFCLCKDKKYNETFEVKYYLNEKSLELIEDGINLCDYFDGYSNDVIFEENYKNIHYGYVYAQTVKSALSQDVFVYCDMNIDDDMDGESIAEKAMPRIFAFYEIGNIDVDKLSRELEAFAGSQEYKSQAVYICGCKKLVPEEIVEKKNESAESFEFRLETEFNEVVVMDYFYTMENQGVVGGIQRLKG